MFVLLAAYLVLFSPSPQQGVPPSSPPNLRAPAGPDGGDVQVSSPSPYNQNEFSIDVLRGPPTRRMRTFELAV